MSLNHERVQPILRVDGLNVELKIRNKQKKLVENVSFEVEPGQCLGILGESGSGKSMTVKAILGLLDRQFRIEGQAWFEGKDLCRKGHGDAQGPFPAQDPAPKALRADFHRASRSSGSQPYPDRHQQHTRQGQHHRKGHPPFAGRCLHAP